MLPDPKFPNQHWSEMLQDFQIDMQAQSGASNGIICYKFFKALLNDPDAVVIGFSAPNRYELPPPGNWRTDSHQNITEIESQAADLFKITACEEMLLFKSCVMARSLLLTCEQKSIPYAWSLNLLFNDLSTLPYPWHPIVKDILGDFFQTMTETNLATYQGWKSSPGFHTDDNEWQTRFAREVSEILCK